MSFHQLVSIVSFSAPTSFPVSVEPRVLSVTEKVAIQQPKPMAEKPLTEAEVRKIKAISILRSKFHRDAAEVLEGISSPREGREALEDALRDNNVPRGVCHEWILPLVQQMEVEDATSKLEAWLAEVYDGASLVFNPHPDRSDALAAKGCLRRAREIVFDGRDLATIEQMITSTESIDFPNSFFCGNSPFLQVLEAAKGAEERKKASTLLNGLRKVVDDQANLVFDANPRVVNKKKLIHPHPVTGFAGGENGKSAKISRQERDARRAANRAKRSGPKGRKSGKK